MREGGGKVSRQFVVKVSVWSLSVIVRAAHVAGNTESFSLGVAH